jgi:hypothetical protein
MLNTVVEKRTNVQRSLQEQTRILQHVTPVPVRDAITASAVGAAVC